jgi:hypothetical protein
MWRPTVSKNLAEGSNRQGYKRRRWVTIALSRAFFLYFEAPPSVSPCCHFAKSPRKFLLVHFSFTSRDCLVKEILVREKISAKCGWYHFFSPAMWFWGGGMWVIFIFQLFSVVPRLCWNFYFLGQNLRNFLISWTIDRWLDYFWRTYTDKKRDVSYMSISDDLII